MVCQFLYNSSEHCTCYHNGTMAPHYKLTYFGIRARAEPTRIVFAYAGVDYEDVRISFENRAEEWPPVKNSKYETRILQMTQGSVKRQIRRKTLCDDANVWERKDSLFVLNFATLARQYLSRHFIFGKKNATYRLALKFLSPLASNMTPP